MMFNKNNPIRLIELFAGIGSQAKALKNLGINFEHWCICEFDESAVKAYNAVHGTTFEPSDITKITAKNLNIHDTDHFTYLLTRSLAKIYQTPGKVWVWKKEAEQEVVCYGKLKDY